MGVLVIRFVAYALLILIIGSNARSSNRRPYPSRLRPSKIRVALTRDLEKNCRLEALLSGIDCINIPCITYGTGRDSLSQEALSICDSIVISSPQVL